MTEDLIQQEKGFWSTSGPFSDIVLSSRIRLARNLKGAFFVNKFVDTDIEKITSVCKQFVKNSCYSKNLKFIPLNEIGDSERRFLRERNIITYEMEVSDNSGVIINELDDFIILVNDEDHFRIQIIKPGLQLTDSYRLADRVDDELNKFVTYSFSKDFGYLTQCPSNIGTGMKASTLLHLPVLTIKNNILPIISKVKKIGAVMTGTTDNNDKTVGSIFQVSNKISIGISEIDIIEFVDGVVNKILELEDSTRDKYISESRSELIDKIWRSYGIIKYARKLLYSEAMEHLSNIRLGIILAIIKKIDLEFINDLMVNIQWSHLQRYFNEIINNTEECDEYRAEYLRKCLKKLE